MARAMKCVTKGKSRMLREQDKSLRAGVLVNHRLAELFCAMQHIALLPSEKFGTLPPLGEANSAGREHAETEEGE
jgi:hypothetical protein